MERLTAREVNGSRGESYLQCVIRETYEEFGITLDPNSCTLVGRIHCFSGVRPYDHIVRVDIFRCISFTGTPHPTEEMEPAWFPVSTLPWEDMHEGDIHWFKKAIRGERFAANIYYRAPGEGFISYEPVAV